MVTWSTCALVALVSGAVGAGMAFGVMLAVGASQRVKQAKREADARIKAQTVAALERIMQDAVNETMREMAKNVKRAVEDDGAGTEH